MYNRAIKRIMIYPISLLALGASAGLAYKCSGCRLMAVLCLRGRIMSINLITDNSWSDILKIQEEAYLEIEPEDVDILKSKWLLSPNTCAVFK